MIRVTVGQLEENVTGYVASVEEGETVLISRNGEAVAQLNSVHTGKCKNRPFGLCEGKFVVPPDFDKPLPDGIIAEFEGE